ncbi:uncharacterized protein LOC141614606 [Silene latifolia]|uniref:uncharacterized protein LOC141614606 n=1 Tax=Silene latifolia TaxID=37657 RepID=UPI003D77C9FE
MALVFGFYVLLLVSNVTGQGSEKCGLGNIQYGVVRSGRIVGGKDEWNVTMLHTCKSCSMGNIIFGNCENWNTVEPVDPDIFLKHERFCILKRGQFLKPGETVHFSYAWDLPVVSFPSSADVRCNGQPTYSITV